MSSSPSKSQLNQVTSLLVDKLPSGDHKFRLKKYRKCFRGSDAVSVLCECSDDTKCTSRKQAVALCQNLLNNRLLRPLTSDGTFKDDNNLYGLSPHIAQQSMDLHFADSSCKSMADVDLSASVRACVAQAVTSVGLTGADQWSLMCEGRWLSPDSPLMDQWNTTSSSSTTTTTSSAKLYLRRKFFVNNDIEPSGWEQTIMFHHCRASVASGTFMCTPEQVLVLGGMAAQAMYGDHDGGREHVAGFLQLRRFFPPYVDKQLMESKLLDNEWPARRGTSKKDSERYFLRYVRENVPAYGITRFPVNEHGAKKGVWEVGVTNKSIFRVFNGQMVEEIPLSSLRSWNLQAKKLTLDFGDARPTYVVSTPVGREILGFVSGYQFLNSIGDALLKDGLTIHYQLSHAEEAPTTLKNVSVEPAHTAGEVCVQVLRTLDDVTEEEMNSFSLRTNKRWVSSDEPIGGLGVSEFWLEPHTILHDVAAAGDEDTLKTLCSQFPLDIRTVDGDTALHKATKGGHKMCVATLLREGANPRLRNLAGEFGVLAKLDLSRCSLSYIPPLLMGCGHHLTELNLSDNQLVSLPLSLLNLTSLKSLVLDNNPLPTLPLNIRQSKEVNDVFAYLQSRGEMTTSPTGKIVLIGPSRSGKTTLAQSLGGISVAEASEYQPTRGMTEFRFIMDEIHVRCCDFTGHTGFSSVLPLYYTQDAVYCVFEPLSQYDLARLLLNCESIPEGCPIVVCLTFADASSNDPKDTIYQIREQLAEHGISVSAVLTVDPRDQDAVKQTVASSLATGFVDVGAKVRKIPKSFLVLENYLEWIRQQENPVSFHALSKDGKIGHNLVAQYHRGKNKEFSQIPQIITEEEFIDHCQSAFVHGEQHIEAATNYLELIGAILPFPDSGLVVLDCSWLAQHLHDLLARRSLYPFGVMHPEVLKVMWPWFDDIGRAALCEMIQYLDIGITQVTLEIPSLFLPSMAPEYANFAAIPVRSSRPFKRRVTVDYPPYLMICRILSSFPCSQVWREGCVVEFEKHHVLVILHHDKNFANVSSDDEQLLDRVELLLASGDIVGDAIVKPMPHLIDSVFNHPLSIALASTSAEFSALSFLRNPDASLVEHAASSLENVMKLAGPAPEIQKSLDSLWEAATKMLGGQRHPEVWEMFEASCRVIHIVVCGTSLSDVDSALVLEAIAVYRNVFDNTTLRLLQQSKMTGEGVVLLRTIEALNPNYLFQLVLDAVATPAADRQLEHRAKRVSTVLLKSNPESAVAILRALVNEDPKTLESELVLLKPKVAPKTKLADGILEQQLLSAYYGDDAMADAVDLATSIDEITDALLRVQLGLTLPGEYMDDGIDKWGLARDTFLADLSANSLIKLCSAVVNIPNNSAAALTALLELVDCFKGFQVTDKVFPTENDVVAKIDDLDAFFVGAHKRQYVDCLDRIEFALDDPVDVSDSELVPWLRRLQRAIRDLSTLPSHQLDLFARKASIDRPLEEIASCFEVVAARSGDRVRESLMSYLRLSQKFQCNSSASGLVPLFEARSITLGSMQSLLTSLMKPQRFLDALKHNTSAVAVGATPEMGLDVPLSILVQRAEHAIFELIECASDSPMSLAEHTCKVGGHVDSFLIACKTHTPLIAEMYSKFAPLYGVANNVCSSMTDNLDAGAKVNIIGRGVLFICELVAGERGHSVSADKVSRSLGERLKVAADAVLSGAREGGDLVEQFKVAASAADDFLASVPVLNRVYRVIASIQETSNAFVEIVRASEVLTLKFKQLSSLRSFNKCTQACLKHLDELGHLIASLDEDDQKEEIVDEHQGSIAEPGQVAPANDDVDDDDNDDWRVVDDDVVENDVVSGDGPCVEPDADASIEGDVVAVVKAMFNYTAKADGELTFKRGQLIDVIGTIDKSVQQWTGVVQETKETGKFSNKYVKLVQ